MKQSLPDGVDADFEGETGGLLKQETSVIFFIILIPQNSLKINNIYYWMNKNRPFIENSLYTLLCVHTRTKLYINILYKKTVNKIYTK